MAIVRERIGHTDHPYHHVLWYDNLLIKYDRPSYGLVGDADGYSQRAHRPYRSPVPSRFVVRQPSYQIKRACFSKSGGGGKFNRPVQGWGSICRFVVRSEDSQRVRSINRIAPQGSHRYSRRGHDTIVLHPSHST